MGCIELAIGKLNARSNPMGPGPLGLPLLLNEYYPLQCRTAGPDGAGCLAFLFT